MYDPMYRLPELQNGSILLLILAVTLSEANVETKKARS